ncbi:MAG TPA: hypothetical protein VFN22_02630 [Gemmatimonadales bacterium]|nr:hypothetical protein [Gemmatimonadales bacterium]
MTARRAVLPTFVAATLVGVAGGWLLARTHDYVQRQDLFARQPWRRFAALGWLERAGDTTALPVLQDYLDWERTPALRARARRVIASLRQELA